MAADPGDEPRGTSHLRTSGILCRSQSRNSARAGARRAAFRAWRRVQPGPHRHRMTAIREERRALRRRHRRGRIRRPSRARRRSAGRAERLRRHWHGRSRCHRDKDRICRRYGRRSACRRIKPDHGRLPSDKAVRDLRQRDERRRQIAQSSCAGWCREGGVAGVFARGTRVIVRCRRLVLEGSVPLAPRVQEEASDVKP